MSQSYQLFHRKVYFIALQYGDTELAEEMMQESVNRTGDIIDPNDLFLAYKLRLLEGHDIFGEFADWKQTARRLTI